jgi:hypothetical protein
MILFKKKTKTKTRHLIEPSSYPDTYTVRKWNGDYYEYTEEIKIESKEHLEKIIAFYSQPTVYF